MTHIIYITDVLCITHIVYVINITYMTKTDKIFF